MFLHASFDTNRWRFFLLIRIVLKCCSGNSDKSKHFLLQRVRSRSLEDVVILNVDTNTLESPFDDLHNLPSDVVRHAHTHAHTHTHTHHT